MVAQSNQFFGVIRTTFLRSAFRADSAFRAIHEKADSDRLLPASTVVLELVLASIFVF